MIDWKQVAAARAMLAAPAFTAKAGLTLVDDYK
jgi:hypothetical protein